MNLKRQLSIPLAAALLLAIATAEALGQATDSPPYRFSITLSQLCQESLANVAPDNYGVKEFFHDLNAIADMPLKADQTAPAVNPSLTGKASPLENNQPVADVERVAPRFDSLELTWRDLQALKVDPTDEKTLDNVTTLLQLVTVQPQFKVRRISLRGGEFDLGKNDRAPDPVAHFRQWVKLARGLGCPEISIGCDFFALTRTAEGSDRLEQQLTPLAAMCSEAEGTAGPPIVLLVETAFDVVGRENEFFEMLLKSGRDNVGVLVNVSELRHRGPLSNFFETARAHTSLIRSLAVDARDEPPPFWDDVLTQLRRMRELSSPLPRPMPAKPAPSKTPSPSDSHPLKSSDSGDVRGQDGDKSLQPRLPSKDQLPSKNIEADPKPDIAPPTGNAKPVGEQPVAQRSAAKNPGAGAARVAIPEMNITIRYRGARFRPQNANDATEHKVRIRRIAEAIETNLPKPGVLAY